MGAELPADILGDEWKGYIVRITGGNDKQGFPMKQGVLQPSRVRLLLSDGHSCYRVRRPVSASASLSVAALLAPTCPSWLCLLSSRASRTSLA